MVIQPCGIKGKGAARGDRAFFKGIAVGIGQAFGNAVARQGYIAVRAVEKGYGVVAVVVRGGGDLADPKSADYKLAGRL